MNNIDWHIIDESYLRMSVINYSGRYSVSIYIRYYHSIRVFEFDVWSMIDRRNKYSGKLNFNYFEI